jgi:signal transduction histidine kinase
MVAAVQTKTRMLGKMTPMFCRMIKFFVFVAFIYSTRIVLGSNREFGHPLFRTFTACDHGGIGPALTVTQDSQSSLTIALSKFDPARVFLSIGVESEEYVLAFTIEPPWYRGVWMEIVYGLAILFGFYVFGRWRTWQMRRREQELVQLVDLRTEEVRKHEVLLRNAKEAAELARENAETANRAKTAFLANMSHELRTPLNTILGYAQILLRRLDHRDEEKTKLKSILSSGEHLLEMINEVLDISRVESGKVSIALRSLEVPKFIAGIIDKFQLRAARGNLRGSYDFLGFIWNNV